MSLPVETADPTAKMAAPSEIVYFLDILSETTPEHFQLARRTVRRRVGAYRLSFQSEQTEAG